MFCYMNWSILLVSIVSGLVTWIFMYLDARLFDTPKSKFTYFKGITFVSGLSALIVYFMGSPKLQVGGSVQSLPPAHMGTAMINDIGQEVMTGLPNF